MDDSAKYIVVACDSFKGSLTSLRAGDAIRQGIAEKWPDAVVRVVPVSDGGEGLTEALVENLGGKYLTCRTVNAIGNPITARYGEIVFKHRRTAVIEMAAACGLPQIPVGERDVMESSSYGFGKMMLHAAENGVEDMILGLGGSASCDGGMGLLDAFGVKFPIGGNRILSPSGAMLRYIRSIDISKMNYLSKHLRIRVACDVENPLYGPTGAAAVFAPQKGATPEDVVLLDQGLRNFAACTLKATGVDVAQTPGAGAAGGVGASLVGYFNTVLERGSRLMLDAIDFNSMIKGADLIITGEGKIDSQTLMGKMPQGILETGLKAGVPVAAIGGIVEAGNALSEAGFDVVVQACPDGMSVNEAMRQDVAKKNLKRAAREVLQQIFG